MRNDSEPEHPLHLCAACGAAFSATAVAGHCPKCLLRLAWSGQSEVSDAAVLSPLHTEAPELFSDYELGQEIARGGMGVVRRARQISLDRVVALKLIATGQFASSELVQRFQIEAAAAARLDHPSIVPIYEIGEHRGQVYYSMKLMDGGNLAARLANPNRRPTFRQSAQWVAELAEAIEFAHQHGVLHRDLKPSNVLLESSGRACVADFGLAKLIEAEGGITLSTTVLGTPAYMPPEQAEGNARAISTASDIYSLGAILYELITGRPPFQAESAVATMRLVIEREPARPRAVNPGVPLDLETICLKCLEKEPAKRYATARELADDLQRFLRDEPVQARAVSATERAWRWCRRKPALAALSGASLLLLLVILTGGPVALYRINLERHRAERLRDEAEAQAYTSAMNLAFQAWKDGHLKSATNLLQAHRPGANRRDRRGFEWRYLWQLCRDERVHTLPVDAHDPVRRLVGSPRHTFVVAARAGSVDLLDPRTGKELARLAYPNPDAGKPAPAVAVASQATNILAAHRADGLVAIWDLAQGTVPFTLKLADEVRSLALSPNGRLLAIAEVRTRERNLREGSLRLLDISNRTRPIQLWKKDLKPSPMPGLTLMQFSPDGSALVANANSWSEGTLAAWDTLTSQELARFPNQSVGTLGALTFSPDGLLLASSGIESRIEVWNFAKRAVAFTLGEHLGRVNCLAFSPDGRQLASANAGGTIRIWDLATRKEIAILRDPEERDIQSVLFGPDGTSILSATLNELSVWKTKSRPMAEVLFADHELGSVAVSPDDKWLVSVGATNWDGPGAISSARVWSLPARQERFQLVLRKQEALDPVFSPDGRYLAIGGEGQEYVVGLWDTLLWDTATGRIAACAWLTNDFEACSVAFSPDSRVLATAGLWLPASPNLSDATNRLAFWDVASRQKLNLLPTAGIGTSKSTAAVTVDFSNNGCWLAVGYRDGAVRLWDLETQQRLADLQEQHGEDGFGAKVSFSPNSRYLVSVVLPGDLAVYNLEEPTKPRLVIKRQAHPGGTWSALFSSDSRSLVSSGNDGLIRVWNIETGKVALTLEHSDGPDVFISMPRAGDLLVSRDAHGMIKLWPAPFPADLRSRGDPH